MRLKCCMALVLAATASASLPLALQAQTEGGRASQATPAVPAGGQPRGQAQGPRLPCPIGSVPRAPGDNRPPTSPDLIAALSQQDKTALLDCLTKTSAEGNGASAGLLGEQYHAGNGIVAQDDKKAFEYTQLAIKLGNTRSLTNLATMYMDGQGVKQDQAEGMRLYLQAANGGDMKAPRDVGVNYEFGKGTPVDYDKAAHFYQMAADRNDLTGECLLGSLYERGLGVSQSYDKAIELYTKSAARGDIISSPGEEQLGDLWETRKDGKQNLQLAAEWYKKAADLKFHVAQADFARLSGPNPKALPAPRNSCLLLFDQKCDLPTTKACSSPSK